MIRTNQFRNTSIILRSWFHNWFKRYWPRQPITIVDFKFVSFSNSPSNASSEELVCLIRFFSKQKTGWSCLGLEKREFLKYLAQYFCHQQIRILNQPPSLFYNQRLIKTRDVFETHSSFIFSPTHIFLFCLVHSFSIFLCSPPKSCHSYLNFVV